MLSLLALLIGYANAELPIDDAPPAASTQTKEHLTAWTGFFLVPAGETVGGQTPLVKFVFQSNVRAGQEMVMVNGTAIGDGLWRFSVPKKISDRNVIAFFDEVTLHPNGTMTATWSRQDVTYTFVVEDYGRQSSGEFSLGHHYKVDLERVTGCVGTGCPTK